jgi:hypothetical protein
MTCARNTIEQVREIQALDCDDLFDNWDENVSINFGECPSKFSFENEQATKSPKNKKVDLNVNLLEIFDLLDQKTTDHGPTDDDDSASFHTEQKKRFAIEVGTTPRKKHNDDMRKTKNEFIIKDYSSLDTNPGSLRTGKIRIPIKSPTLNFREICPLGGHRGMWSNYNKSVKSFRIGSSVCTDENFGNINLPTLVIGKGSGTVTGTTSPNIFCQPLPMLGQIGQNHLLQIPGGLAPVRTRSFRGNPPVQVVTKTRHCMNFGNTGKTGSMR